MDKRNNAFESFITNILKTHDGNDKLRALSVPSAGLRDSVDKFLFESQLEAFFIPHEDPEQYEYQGTIDKLEKLKHAIVSKHPRSSDSPEYDIVNMVLTKYSEKNCLLSREILLYLNSLYKEYT